MSSNEPARDHLGQQQFNLLGNVLFRMVVVNKRHSKRPIGERPNEMLFDLAADPWEFENVADSPHYAEALADLRRRLDVWMAETDDPIRHGPIPPPPGAKVTPHDAVSP